MAITTYPPAFDPDRIVPEDLGVNNIDVFMEGDGNNPMFFYINGLNKIFTYGKHYFTLSFKNQQDLKYKLKDNTEIIFEIRDNNNNKWRTQNLT